MTPVEALERAVTQMFDAEDMAESDYDLAGPFILTALRKLGFTVVPAEPTDKTVEMMARVLAEWQGFYDNYDFDNGLIPVEAAEAFRNYARAAYAAVVWEVAGG